MEKSSVLEVKHLTKRFSGVVANNSIDLDLREGEIISIIGENGAGKSTFCKMLTGVYHPDEGEIFIDGKRAAIKNPQDSMKLGIGMVYQERNLVNGLTGAQNICLGTESTSGIFLNEKAMRARAKKIQEDLGIDVPLDVPIDSLGAGEKQLIEIMRALVSNPRILILDEPTASLGESEIGPFLDFVQGISKNLNVSILFISHKIDEVFQISDRIAVFTDGACVLVDEVKNLTKERCVIAMLRSDKIKPVVVPEKDYASLPKVIEVESCEYDGKVHDIRFDVRKGEIVGFYGLVGSGRTECAEMLCGLRPAAHREFILDGQKVERSSSTLEMIHKGVILTPEIRNNGMFKTYSLAENIGILFYEKRLSNKLGFVSRREMNKLADEVLSDNDVKYRNREQPMNDLSGGNKQKIIIGRSIEIEDMKLLILDEPTNGMDIGAKYEVYKKMLKIVEDNTAGIMFISSELDELISLCNRIVVFSEGDVVKVVERSKFDKADILTAALRRGGKHENA